MTIDVLGRIIERVHRFFMKRWRRLTKLLVSNSQEEKVITRRGFLFKIDPREDLQRIVLFEGLHNEKERRICKKIIEEGSIVFDIGAHVGFYTIFFADLASSGKVHSFEPNNKSFSQLEYHAELNGYDNVVTNKFALGDSEGEGDLKIPKGKNGMSSLSEYMYDHFSEKDVKVENSVSIDTLDGYVDSENIEDVDLIKIDVEGWEPFVLLGAESTLQRFRPWILMEVNSSSLEGRGWAPKDLLEILDKYDYEFYKSSPVMSGFRQIHPGKNYGTIYDVVCRPINH